jgi:hypothetical protein
MKRLGFALFRLAGANRLFVRNVPVYPAHSQDIHWWETKAVESNIVGRRPSRCGNAGIGGKFFNDARMRRRSCR